MQLNYVEYLKAMHLHLEFKTTIMTTYLKNWENPTGAKRNEIVFANRNKEYGAYVLRKGYNSTVSRALLMSVAPFLLLFGSAFIYNKLNVPAIKESVNEGVMVWREVIVELPVEKPLEKPMQKPMERKSSAQDVFTEPVVKDQKVDDKMKSQQQLAVTDFGVKKDSSDAVLPPITGTGNKPAVDSVNTSPVIHAEQMPVFPGGDAAMISYLSKNMVYPHKAREINRSGTVYISFVIDRSGNVINTELIRGIGEGCDEEAMRVVRNMPRWSPGLQNKQPVMVKLVLPVKFSLR